MADKKFHRAEYEVVIDLPRAKVWEKLRDISQAHNYVPGIIKTVVTTDKTEGVGASRRVVSRVMALDETIVQWCEGKGFRIKLHQGKKSPAMFKEAYFTYTISDTEDGKTKLITAMDYIMPFGPIGRIATNLILQGVVYSNIRDVALSAKSYYETGNKPKKSVLKGLRKTLAK